MTSREFKIYGQVQGVLFRASAQKKAKQIGLKGWVRNEPDGTVLLLAFGTEEQVSEMETWCYDGSDTAKVTHVEALDSNEVPPSETFEVLQ